MMINFKGFWKKNILAIMTQDIFKSIFQIAFAKSIENSKWEEG